MHFGLESYVPLAIYLSGIVAFLLSVWRPYIGVYYLVPLLPMQTVRFRLHEYPLGQSMVDIILLGVVLGLLIHRRPLILKNPLTKLLLVYIAFTYLWLWKGSFFLDAPLPLWINDIRFSDWKNYVIMPILFLFFTSAIEDAKQMKILIVLMCVSLLLVAKGFHGTVGDRDASQYSDALRYAGVLGYAGENGLGAFEAQMSIVLLGLYAFEHRKLVKLAYVGVLVACVYCLMYSFSRGGYVAFAAGLVFMGVLKERKLLLLVLVSAIGWQTLAPLAVRQRIAMTYSDGELDSSVGTRLTLWDGALEIFDGDPVLGSGVETYKHTEHYRGYQDTHNLYLKILVETGIFGLSIFLIILWRIYRAGYSLFRSSNDPFFASLGLGVAGYIVCVFFANLFGDRWTYLQVNGFLWTLLACVVRAQTILKEQAADGEDLPPSAELCEASGQQALA